MDTKWKFEPTEGDMYQMFAYAKRYNAKKIYLLCPPNVEENIYRAEDFSVQIVSVDLFNMENMRYLGDDISAGPVFFFIDKEKSVHTFNLSY